MPYADPEKARAYHREYMHRRYGEAGPFRDAHLARVRKNKKPYQARLRAIIVSTKVACLRCGEDHPAALDFHHRDPAAKDFTLASAVHDGWGEDRIRAEIAKCDVLCANCHRKEHALEDSHQGSEGWVVRRPAATPGGTAAGNTFGRRQQP